MTIIVIGMSVHLRSGLDMLTPCCTMLHKYYSFEIE